VGRVARALRRPTTYSGHAREALSTVVTASMWPLGWSAPKLPELPEQPSASTPVLLVHGYGANKSNWHFLTRHLGSVGFDRYHAVNYNPLSGDIPRLAEQLVERATEFKDHLGTERIHLVGHSLGGVISRYAIQVLGLEGVDTCVTVASPHGGVRLARHGSQLTAISPLHSGLQLRPDSPVMTLLRSSARPMSTRWVAYYSNLDLVVPARRAMILEPELEATNILVKDHGHLSILLSRRLAASIVDQFGAADGLPGYGAPVAPFVARRPRATASPARPERMATGEG
jgi:pimeloyl-ACP methyl ester carboxylesterase